MRKRLLQFLCDPVDKSDLELVASSANDETVFEGTLKSASGRSYPIRDGIPRFVDASPITQSVSSFGDEWNLFNYDRFKVNWLDHVVGNTFGSVAAFRGKVILDAGGGSGLQSRWMAEAGASLVICLELSHSVDGVMKRNLEGIENVEVVQCTIDQPPIRAHSVPGIVICHNVIQHTPSVFRTAHALWDTVGPGGEFVFNCYSRNDDDDLIRTARFAWHGLVRRLVSQRSFKTRLAYAKAMAALRFVPGVGTVLEKSNTMYRGPVPAGPDYTKRAFWQAALNTFDEFGAHAYQHYERRADIKALVARLPGKSHILNADRYFAVPQHPGCALRVFRSAVEHEPVG